MVNVSRHISRTDTHITDVGIVKGIAAVDEVGFHDIRFSAVDTLKDTESPRVTRNLVALDRILVIGVIFLNNAVCFRNGVRSNRNARKKREASVAVHKVVGLARRRQVVATLRRIEGVGEYHDVRAVCHTDLIVIHTVNESVHRLAGVFCARIRELIGLADRIRKIYGVNVIAVDHVIVVRKCLVLLLLHSNLVAEEDNLLAVHGVRRRLPSARRRILAACKFRRLVRVRVFKTDFRRRVNFRADGNVAEYLIVTLVRQVDDRIDQGLSARIVAADDGEV